MKETELYFYPIFSKRDYKGICYFYVSLWDNIRDECPKQVYWMPIHFPEISSHPRWMEEIEPYLIGTILFCKFVQMLYDFEEIKGEVYFHAVDQEILLDQCMEALFHFSEYAYGNTMSYKTVNNKHLPMNSDLKDTNGYRVLRSLSNRSFSIMTNLIQSNHIESLLKNLLNIDKTNHIMHSYLNTYFVIERKEYSRKDAIQRMKKFVGNPGAIYPFNKFMGK